MLTACEDSEKIFLLANKTEFYLYKFQKKQTGDSKMPMHKRTGTIFYTLYI